MTQKRVNNSQKNPQFKLQNKRNLRPLFFFQYELQLLAVKLKLTYYTVSQKKHVTTFSTITLTIGVRLQ